MLQLLPLVVAILVLFTFVAAPYSSRLDGLLARTAFSIFDGGSLAINKRRERSLRTASIGTPYREYATKTYLYTFGSAFAGAIIGVYIGAAILATVRALGLSGTTPSLGLFTNLPDLSWLPAVPGVRELLALDSFVFLLFLGSSMATGLFLGLGVYAIRWKLPEIRSDTRRRQIDAGMPRMVAFIYALTRGGMAFPDVMRALSRNEGVFGEGASEVGIAVRNMDLFNVDLVTAVQDLSQQTPSDQFERFSENLGSVLQSGRNISTFLKEEYERYREEAEEQQEEILELLATTAEVYVTTVVAGMLFLVTILLIIGLTAGDTLLLIQLIAYIILPAGNLLFLAYLAEITQPLRASRDSSRILAGGEEPTGHQQLEADGGYERAGSRANWDRLRAYERIRTIRSTLTTPIQSAINKPTLIFYVTVPLVVALTAYRIPSAFTDGAIDLRVLDDILVQSVLLLMATFAVVYETSKRRLRRLEEAVPDLLERLASLNEAGIAVVSSFDRVRSSDVGALDEEVDRIWRDIQWGATVAQALDRFESRVQTPSITRVVTLITNAMRASNEIGPVLRIAAEQARADQRLRRQRRQEMFTYLVVIYVSFIVFLIVIMALDYVLIPNLPDTGAISGPGTGSSGFIGGFESGDVDDYRLAFFHTAIIQSALSGLVGGMMGAGSIKDGVKHSTIMLTVTYVILTLLG